MPVQLTKSLVFALTLSAFPGAGAALAAGSHAGGHGSGIGEPANAAAADRTIEIAMGDNFYEPERLTIGAGETEIGRAHVRTPVTNAHLVCRLLLEKKNKVTLVELCSILFHHLMSISLSVQLSEDHYND